MISTAILNAVLALGVIVMVIAPLVWAIRTQSRDEATTLAPNPGRASHGHEAPRRSYRQPHLGAAAGRT